MSVNRSYKYIDAIFFFNLIYLEDNCFILESINAFLFLVKLGKNPRKYSQLVGHSEKKTYIEKKTDTHTHTLRFLP